jgi:hypothetical protein
LSLYSAGISSSKVCNNFPYFIARPQKLLLLLTPKASHPTKLLTSKPKRITGKLHLPVDFSKYACREESEGGEEEKGKKTQQLQDNDPQTHHANPFSTPLFP